MPRCDFGQPVAAVKQLDRLLGGAVHRVDELQIANTEVVFRLRFDVYLLDRGHGCVAAGFRERHRRRLICQHVDRVLRQAAARSLFGDSSSMR